MFVNKCSIIFIILVLSGVIAETTRKNIEGLGKNEVQNVEESYIDKLTKRYISRAPYIMLPPLLISIVKQGQLVGYFSINYELKTSSLENYRRCRALLLLLNEAILCDLYDAMNRLWLGPKAPPINILNERIMYNSNKFLGKGSITKAVVHFAYLEMLPTMSSKV